ncbi:MurR/RpiR family transcriptional regulator [Ensifer sp.]|uniref:MurR/RpiR family transcriptional regulator n=1 Tax=Ensifer sp. TaxID=1872086 RepID=UPI000DD9A071|nr:MurR/RpiR family transcriptional regulator [Ensifer sp.]
MDQPSFALPAHGQIPPASVPELKEAFRLRARGLKGGRLEVAKFALSHPYDIAFASAREVAARAGVSTSTVMRLINDLGFEKYAAFQNLFREELRRGRQ